MKHDFRRLGGKLAIVVFASLLFASSALADCDTRHFYNNSTVLFSVTLVMGSCSIGGSGMQKQCIVPPGQVAELHYSNFPIEEDGIAMWSLDPGSRLYRGSFPVAIPDGCYILHSGNTGNVAVNSDANGDVATCGPLPAGSGPNAGWQCN